MPRKMVGVGFGAFTTAFPPAGGGGGGGGGGSPDLLDSSFESGWDSWHDAGGGAPQSGLGMAISRDTAHPGAGVYGLKAVWSADSGWGTDGGAKLYCPPFAPQDRVYLRFLYWLASGWSVTGVMKFLRFNNAVGGYPGGRGGLWLADDVGLAGGFDTEGSSVIASIIPKAALPTNGSHEIVLDYARNNGPLGPGGADLPSIGVRLDGTPQTQPDGTDTGQVSGQTVWYNGRLFPNTARGSTEKIDVFQLWGTLNEGEAGGGSMWIDPVQVASTDVF